MTALGIFINIKKTGKTKPMGNFMQYSRNKIILIDRRISINPRIPGNSRIKPGNYIRIPRTRQLLFHEFFDQRDWIIYPRFGGTIEIDKIIGRPATGQCIAP